MTVTTSFIIFFLFICFFYFLYKNKKELQQKYDQRVRKIQEEQQLQKIVDKIKQEQKEARQRLNNIENKIEEKRQQYQTKYNIEKEVIFNELEKQLLMYKQAKKQAIQAQVQVYSKNLKSKMAQSQNELIQLQSEIEATAAQLTKLQDTRKAAYNAILKQKEVKEQADNYRLLPSTIELSDIKKLQKVKLELAKPRILSMLIWQTYWQPLAKNKFPIILKDKTKTGIYKITNLETNECYIGQAVDIYKRWNQHCKAGLGIDTPPGNKLYKAIQEYGLQNFTFEILLECNRDELNDKERYFIGLYQADTYGYNGNIGVNKK